MTLNDIDRKSPEGRLLWAALIVLTTSPGLQIAGEEVRGTETTPDEMLANLESLAQLEEKLSPDPKTEDPLNPNWAEPNPYPIEPGRLQTENETDVWPDIRDENITGRLLG